MDGWMMDGIVPTVLWDLKGKDRQGKKRICFYGLIIHG
jgi:hypothetical protein